MKTRFSYRTNPHSERKNIIIIIILKRDILYNGKTVTGICTYMKKKMYKIYCNVCTYYNRCAKNIIMNTI